MNKYSKALAAIWQIIHNPWLLNKVLDDDAHWEKLIRKSSGLTQAFPLLVPWELFGDFNETIKPFAFLDGGSLPTDLALLKKLARQYPDCTYFEIGTWRGESVANVADVANECFTLNLSPEEMGQMGLDHDYIGQHGYFSKHLNNVTHLEGNTQNFDFGIMNRKFDLVFIDGDHHFEMVKNDTEKVFRHLIHDNSTVVWHDYARNPETVRHEIMAGILAGTPSHLHGKIYHIAHTLCAVYFPGEITAPKYSLPVLPSGHFKVDIGYESFVS